MIDNASMQLLLDLLENPMMHPSDVGMRYGWSIYQVRQRIALLNDYLVPAGFDPIMLKNNHWVIDETISQQIVADTFLTDEALVLEEYMRVPVIYLYTFIRQSEVSNDHLQWLLKVSKNTALADVKALRELCLVHHVQFSYTRKDGYHLSGTELHKRQVALMFLNKLLDYPNGKQAIRYLIAAWDLPTRLGKTREQLYAIIEQAGLRVPPARLTDLAIFYRLVVARKQDDLQFTEAQEAVLRYSSLQDVATTLCKVLGLSSPLERWYMVAQLLANVEGTPNEQHSVVIRSWTYQIVDRLEQQMLVTFDKRREVLEGLFQHLLPAYYRLLFDVPVRNPLASEVLHQYAFLAENVKRALLPLERSLRKEITAGELAYLVMFFGGHLYDRVHRTQSLHAKVICPNGISAASMLKAQLQRLFPMFRWSVDAFQQEPDLRGVDMVFSTVLMHATIPVYVTKPLLSAVEQNYLLAVVGRDFNIVGYQLPTGRALLDIVKRHATVHDTTALEQELDRYVQRYLMNERRGDPMLKELLTEPYITFAPTPDSWEKAIRLSVAPLVEYGHVNDQYAEAIIHKVQEFGPYIHIGGGVAIPHARPEDGVSRLGMSFIKLEQPILLANDPNHAVDVLIALAAVDNTTHLTALAELTKILSDKVQLARLKQATSIVDVLSLLNREEEEAI